MAEDLKLEIVIQALLDAKGFEDAKRNLEGLTVATNKAGDEADKGSEKQKKLTSAFGGSRGPVADLTRVLLINVGATRGAGEAAKFAGVGLAALEAGAVGATLPLIGLTAVVALLLPKIVEWMSKTEEQTGEQAKLTQEVTNALPILERYASVVKNMNEAAQLQLQAQRVELLRKERVEFNELDRTVTALQNIMNNRKAAGQWIDPEDERRLMNARGRFMDLTEAQAAGITVEELYTRRIKEETEAQKQATEAARAREKAESELMDTEMRRSAATLTAQVAAIRFAQDQEKDAERHMKEDANKKAKAAKADIRVQSEHHMAERRLIEEGVRISERAAELKVQHAVTAAAGVGATLSALSSVFNNNKSLAIAGAIVDTYAAGLQVFRDPFFIGRPWERAIAMAATIATGMAQVQNIRKAGTVGFDDPFADMTARRLGRTSAVDFVENFGSEFIPGVRRGMAGAMRGGNTYSSTVNNNYNTNVNALRNRTEFRKFLAVEMAEANKVESRRTIGR